MEASHGADDPAAYQLVTRLAAAAFGGSTELVALLLQASARSIERPYSNGALAAACSQPGLQAFERCQSVAGFCRLHCCTARGGDTAGADVKHAALAAAERGAPAVWRDARELLLGVALVIKQADCLVVSHFVGVLACDWL